VLKGTYLDNIVAVIYVGESAAESKRRTAERDIYIVPKLTAGTSTRIRRTVSAAG